MKPVRLFYGLLLALFLGVSAGPIGLISLKPAPVSEGGGGDPGVLQELETFTLPPMYNDEGRMVFHAYTGEDPGSSAAVVGGALRLTGGGVAQSIYMLFQPIVGGAGTFPFDTGYAQSRLRSGTWNPDNNRLGFLARWDTPLNYRTDRGEVLQFGTYVKDHAHSQLTEQGRHFYHFYNVQQPVNVWLAYVVDQHPQHERNRPGNYADNPTLYVNPTDGDYMSNEGPVSYMDGLTLFYYDPQPSTGLTNAVVDLDDFYFWQRDGEPDYYISSLAYCYDGTRYNVYWSGLMNQAYSFEVRYRTDGVSMHTAGFATGTNGDAGATSNPNSAYKGNRWQSSLMAEDTDGIYVAIRVTGQTDFREVYIPYQMAPGNNGFSQMAD
jgi:hypothetical protein